MFDRRRNTGLFMFEVLRRSSLNGFNFACGKEVESRVTKLKGVITSRSQNLYGCNRYFIQPPVGADGKVPDGWWVDEDDITVTGDGVAAKPKPTGGPMSRKC